MMDSFLPLLLLFAFSMLGVMLGTITGIVPGFHPNNVAFIVLSISPLILGQLHFLTAFFPSANILVLVASTILAASVAHTFLSFIPAAFIGAPEGDTALCVLPAHRLLLEGKENNFVYFLILGKELISLPLTLEILLKAVFKKPLPYI